MTVTAKILKEMGRSYVPIRLKGVLARHGISQAMLGKAIDQSAGHRMSRSAINMLLNWNHWPARTPSPTIKTQIHALLADAGVPADDIATVWELDVEDEFRGANPLVGGANVRTVQPALVDSPFAFEHPLPEVEMLSQSARKHFSLFRDPFVDDVQTADDVFLSAEQRYIREAMFTTAKHGGFLAVIGESGAGKTVLRRDLIDRIQRESQPVTVIQPRIIDKGRLTAGAICDAIICDVSQESLGGSLEAKARKIERLLTGSSRAGNSHVLMIEEAHDLHVSTLKYLKRFWELEDGFRKLLSIILIGQPELKNKLDERVNWDAREVIRRCEIAELQPLNGDMEQYLQLKFQRVGKTLDEVFDARAFDAIRDRLTLRRRGADQTVSMHYPLVVNNTVVKCMNLAAEIGAARITSDVVAGV
jgi:type II secretory pathway predicted ATPase ExeA